MTYFQGMDDIRAAAGTDDQTTGEDLMSHQIGTSSGVTGLGSASAGTCLIVVVGLCLLGLWAINYGFKNV